MTKKQIIITIVAAMLTIGSLTGCKDRWTAFWDSKIEYHRGFIGSMPLPDHRPKDPYKVLPSMRRW